MNLYDVITTRRSVRSYKPDPVDEKTLDRILDAALEAPSAANRQPWYFVVIRDEAVRRKLKEAYSQEWFWSAPVIICACGMPNKAWKRSDGKNYVDVDVAIAMDHLILAATAEGLGTCWIGAFRPDIVKEVLDLPDTIEPIAMTPLGYPADKPKPTERKPRKETVRFMG